MLITLGALIPANVLYVIHLPLHDSTQILPRESGLTLLLQIDSIHHDLHLACALLAKRYNSQVPANRLHPELLGMVFQHLRAPVEVFNPEEPYEKPTFNSYKPLVHAMMVCRKWHVVGSEMASLWTDVDYSLTGSEDRPSRLLKRSGMTPIHLRLDVSVLGEDHTYLHEMVGANAFRLRQLDVSMSDTDTMSAVMQLLGNDMPVLRCLRMWHGSHRGNSVLRNVQGRFPSLRGIALINHL